MSKMLEMIQQSVVPANIMRSASRGALALPASEMLEILVYLAGHPLFGEQARLTLSQWDQASAIAICSDLKTPPKVLEYYLDPCNWRAPLLQALIGNVSVSEDQLEQVAQHSTQEVAQLLLSNPRVVSSPRVLKQLAGNPKLSGTEQGTKALCLLQEVGEVVEEVDEDAILQQIRLQHAEELLADANKKFKLVKTDSDEQDEIAEMVEAVAAGHEARPEAVVAVAKKEPERLSTIQKITRMSVGERVQLAVKGTKDERFVLIRDGSKVVALAVLQSPKLSDAEMETFAAMKNIQQSVLRAIAGNRKFMKQYTVVRALSSNPRCPLDVALKLLPNLLLSDLHNLSKNKNVSDTIRKIALKLHKEKTTTRKS